MKTFGEATLKKGEWTITAEPHVMMKLKRIFGRFGGKTPKSMKVRDTLDVCRDLAWAIERYPLEVKPPDYLHRRATEHRRRSEELEDLFAGRAQPRAFDLAVPARDYQKIAAEAALRRHSLLIADDVGLGKTCSAICMLTEPSTRPALVVTLTHLPRQWKREIERFVPGLKVHIVTKGTAYSLGGSSGDQSALFDDYPDVVIMNYHKLAGWEEALAGKIKTVIFDEAQELRSGMGRETPAKYTAAQGIADRADYRVGLTATPIYNYGGEFYSVLRVLDETALGTWGEFKTEWCVEGYGDKPRIGDPAAFGTWLREHGLMVRRTRTDVGRELPAVSTLVQPVDADLDELEKVKTTAAELARTILGAGRGFDKMRAAEEFDMRVRLATGIAKAPHVAAFVKLLVESGEKVVLFGWHHEVYKLWEEQLADVGVVFYTGKQSQAQKADAIAKFTGDDAKVLVISLRAGAGLDGLQHACRTVVFGELDWSPQVHHQCLGRVARDGQKDPVFAYMLLADVGSDPVVADVLNLKRSQSERALDPDAEIGAIQVDPDHLKKLARSYLEQVGEKFVEATGEEVAAE